MPRKKKKQEKEPLFPGFTLVPGTIGKITDSIWVKDDNTELAIYFATGQILRFKPL